MSSPSLAPGQLAPAGGMYKVFHDGHRPEHFLYIERDAYLPPCRYCGTRVRFALAQGLDRLQQDYDFLGSVYSGS